MEEKLKIKPTVVAVIITVTSIVFFATVLLTGVLSYFEGDKDFVYEYNYTTKSAVQNSPAYDFAIDVFSDIKNDNNIDELKEVKWMKHYKEDFRSYTYQVYFQISYLDNGVLEKVFYINQDATIRDQYRPHYTANDFIKEISEDEYRSVMDSWLVVEDYNKSVLAREKSYNQFALNVFMEVIG